MALTVADLADHLHTAVPANGTPAQRQMTRALNTAVQETTRRTGMLDGVQVTVKVSPDAHDWALRLPYVRLASIDSVTDPGGAAVDMYGVDPLSGLVPLVYAIPAGAYGLSSLFTVTCTGKPWPAALETSALDWAAHLYDTERARTAPVTDDSQQLPSFALPNRVEEMQHPYLLAGIA